MDTRMRRSGTTHARTIREVGRTRGLDLESGTGPASFLLFNLKSELGKLKGDENAV
jgi:hypothetical protein